MNPPRTPLAERIANQIAAIGWEPYGSPMVSREAADACAASLNAGFPMREFQVFPRGSGWIIKRKVR